jgi:hypothetical protein
LNTVSLIETKTNSHLFEEQKSIIHLLIGMPTLGWRKAGEIISKEGLKGNS